VQAIKTKLGELIRKHQPQAIHYRNISSLPIHPAATVAMAECIAEHPQVGFLAQHHDFSFEDDFVPGDRKKAYSIPYSRIQKRVEETLLYTTPQVHHAVINSLMQKSLRAHYGYDATVIPDAFDFETQTTEIADLREKIGVRPHDLVVGTMARIIPRKAMEVAVQFIVALRRRKNEFLGERRGVHGRTITEDTRFFLLLPQASGLDEPSNASYFKKLRKYADEQGVEVLYLGDRVVADSAYEGKPGQIPFYSLYQAVDMLMFPSYQEGFGNQFLEAVALGRGVVVAHLYPVMEADIFPRTPPGGVISLGTNSDYDLDENGLVHLKPGILNAAVDREIHLLRHPDEELALAAQTRQQLKAAFDASVVGKHISELLLKALV
jgi:mannosylglucosylglycerate synthase